MSEEKLSLEKYYPRHKRLKYPCIRILTHGLSFNVCCYPAFQRKDYAELFYDRKLKVIAIKPYHMETAYTVKISGNKKKRVLNVMCRGFLNENKILEFLQLKPHLGLKSKRFKAIWDEKNKWFLIALKADPV